MNKGPLHITLLLLLFVGFSCQKENMDDCFKSTGKIVEEVRVLAPFESMELEDRVNVYVRQDNHQSIIVKAGKNLQEHIDIEVKGTRLFIKNNNKCNWVRSYKKEIDIYLTVPKLNYIVYRGGGDLEFVNAFTQDSLVLDMWKASGNLKVNLYGKYLSLKSHAGTADIMAYGICDDLVLYSNGNGIIEAKDVQSKRALAINKNSGFLSLNCDELIEAEIYGRGNIVYSGNASVDLYKTGSGQLIKR